MPENRIPSRPVQRAQIYDILDGEREYQIETHPERMSLFGFARLIQEYAERMVHDAASDRGFHAQKRIREIAALAVRAAEQHGLWAREFHVPPSAFVSAAVDKRETLK